MRSTIEGRARLLAAMVAVAIPAHSPAQAGGAQRAIPIRQVVTLAATDSGRLASPSSMRPLSDGRILVNDGRLKQLLLFDSTMRAPRIVADTAPGARNLYSARSGGGFEVGRYRGDSSLFIDAGTRSVPATVTVVDPDGNFTRVMAASPRRDANAMIASLRSGKLLFDPRGGLVYSTARSRPPEPRGQLPGRIDTSYTMPSADSGAVVSASLDAFGQVDTIAIYGVEARAQQVVRTAGRTVITYISNPLPDADEWTMLPDGTVAVIRSHDYHVDWHLSDGTKKSTPKMPFDWRHVSAQEKQTLLDSARAFEEERQRIRTAPRPGATVAPVSSVVTTFDFVKADQIREYYPPVRPGQVFADWNGNVWALPSTSAAASGGLLYDVINRDGTIVERVQLPIGRRIVAFGKGDIVYMMAGTPSANPAVSPSARIERARIVR